MSFFCNVIMVSLLCVHAKRTGWKIRLRSKTVILKIKNIKKPQMNQILKHFKMSHCIRCVVVCKHQDKIDVK